MRNFAGGVEILAQGASSNLDEFIRRLRSDAPPLARIRNLKWGQPPIKITDDCPYLDFRIELTESAGGIDVDAARDVATCSACLAELRDPANRRYRHPFINCTDCGPRYTIIESLPYDRPRTSMKAFPMCPECEREYNDPADRRFHAQPVCCPRCGPRPELLDAEGTLVETDDPITRLAEHLADGKIAAIKGIGGFHLACDATSSEAVARLRRLKYREQKPLAVMARDLDAVRRIAAFGPAEQALLESPERPIVLLAKKSAVLPDGRADANGDLRMCSSERSDGHIAIAPVVDPRSSFHGVMLPYTPIHHLLAARLPYLVMTSGNRTEEPIARTNAEAVGKLRGIADIFLVHDRGILTRNDDSVVRVIAGDAVIMRRSRGYAPEPIDAGRNVHGIIACGPMLKNCIAVGRGELCYVSQHIGDLANMETYRSLEHTAKKLCGMLGVEPTLAACDMHPGYPSTRFAESLGLPVVRVQHHHAHIASCIAENGLRGRVIGIAFDGTGYGPAVAAVPDGEPHIDGHTWGSEILIADTCGYERLGHLAYMRMPGGDAAVKHPGRMALGALFPLMGRDAAKAVPWMDPAEAEAVIELLDRNVNTPLTSGMGRLFDAASAILGVCTKSTYEGQPAIELEAVADAAGAYPVELLERDGQFEADGAAILATVCDERGAGVPVPTIAGKFHNTIAGLLLQYAVVARNRTGLGDVCLSGGCFQNALLLEKSVERLEAAGFAVYRHRLVPPNDGCIALGQMVVAANARR